MEVLVRKENHEISNTMPLSEVASRLQENKNLNDEPSLQFYM
jgi:hypothetical protein